MEMTVTHARMKSYQPKVPTPSSLTKASGHCVPYTSALNLRSLEDGPFLKLIVLPLSISSLKYLQFIDEVGIWISISMARWVQLSMADSLFWNYLFVSLENAHEIIIKKIKTAFIILIPTNFKRALVLRIHSCYSLLILKYTHLPSINLDCGSDNALVAIVDIQCGAVITQSIFSQILTKYIS